MITYTNKGIKYMIRLAEVVKEKDMMNNTTATANETVKSILWFSRHNMTVEQIDDLKRIYGSDVTINHVSANAASWKDVVEAGVNDDVLAVVLPPALLADLTNPRNNTKPVIRAIANRVATGKQVINPATGKLEDEFKFVHAGWERIVKIEVVTERL